MKLVFTRNELIVIAKTTMTIPGLMKKFVTDDYIINKFEEKMLELTTKTTAVKCIKSEVDYTIELEELFMLELITEFGSLANAMITLTIGVGGRLKMIADKYKVKDKIKNDDVNNTIPDNKVNDNELGFSISNDPSNVLPTVNGYSLLYTPVVTSVLHIHKHTKRIPIDVLCSYLNSIKLNSKTSFDGLMMAADKIFMLIKDDNYRNIHAYMAEVIDGNILCYKAKSYATINLTMTTENNAIYDSCLDNSDKYFLFFKDIEDVTEFIASNQFTKDDQCISIDDKPDINLPKVNFNYGVYSTHEDISNVLPNIENTTLIKRVLKINDKKYHNHYYKNRIRHLLQDGNYIDGLVLIDGAVYALYSNIDERKPISIYNVKAYELGIVIDDKQLLGEVDGDNIKLLKTLAVVNPDDIYYLFFNTIDDIKNFITKKKSKVYIRFYELDLSFTTRSTLIKNNVIPVDEYDSCMTRLTRGTTQIDGLIFHNGNIYEIRPEGSGDDMSIYLVNKDEYILAGNINKIIDTKVKTNNIEYEYEININDSDDTQSIWIIFFRSLDNMNLFLDKNFKL